MDQQWPDPELLSRLAVNDSGFVFDPVTGRSYTVNPSGLALLRRLQLDGSPDQLGSAMMEQFDAEERDIERDLMEFAAQLRRHFV